MVRKKGVIMPNVFYPVQIIECAKCGFMGLFNSRVLGLLDEDEKKMMSPTKVD